MRDDDQKPNLLGGLRNAEWLDDQDLPVLRWVVPGLIPEGMSLLVGGPKLGKSWLSLAIALAVACGGKVLGAVEVGTARPVLLLAMEDGNRRLQERMRHLMPGEQKPRLLDYMTEVHQGLIGETIAAWLEELPAGSEAPLVIIDTLGKVMPPAKNGESEYLRDYRVGGALKRLADSHPGMAVLALHHDRKAQSEDFVDSVSGTNGIAGAVDTVLVVARKRTETDGIFKVTGRDVDEAEYAVTMQGGRWEAVGDDLRQAAENAKQRRAQVRLGARSASILELASENPDGIRAADVAAHFGDEIEPDQARVYLNRLYDEGRLYKPERGLYTSVTSVTSVTSSEERNSRNTSNTIPGVCLHGMPDGDQPDVWLGGQVRCPQCRAAA